MYWRILFSALTLLATSSAVANTYSYYVSPTEQEAVFHFTNGSVHLDNSTNRITVYLNSGPSYEFTFSEVASHLANGPQERSRMLNDLVLATTMPGVARSFHSDNPDPDWGLSSFGTEPSPGPIQPYSSPRMFNDPAGGCLLGDPLCSNQCDLAPCNPFLGHWGMGPGFSLQMDGGYSDLYGDTPEERECVAQHYRQWLQAQGGVCENAVAESAIAAGAGSVALGSCMQFNRAPNQASGLVCAGSYVILLIQSWRASNATDECLAEYPGPGDEC